MFYFIISNILKIEHWRRFYEIIYSYLVHLLQYLFTTYRRKFYIYTSTNLKYHHGCKYIKHLQVFPRLIPTMLLRSLLDGQNIKNVLITYVSH